MESAARPTLDLAALTRFVLRHPRLFVLTGAGCSTESGIPDYRDARGAWKRKPPVYYQEFVESVHARRRYWARSLIGWPSFAAAVPNDAHHALAALEAAGFVQQLVTQNVDGLHQQAGSRRVVDLHGRLDLVACLGCRAPRPRAAFQQTLAARNPAFVRLSASIAPDGDADLEGVDFTAFAIPDCEDCGGVMKPDVVFFGESVPRSRVEQAYAGLQEADAVLVVGSSLMVYSGYRFCRAAADQGKPIAAINVGHTRADAQLALKLDAPCAPVLAALLQGLAVKDSRNVGDSARHFPGAARA